jgi:2-aminobenzoate-CoA ligase
MTRIEPDVQVPTDRPAEAGLAPCALWPERVYTLPELQRYPDRFNAVEELLDRQVAAGRGDHPAIRYGDETITYAELLAQTNQAANALTRLGVRPGDRVVIRSLNEPPALVTNYAVQRLGAVAVPVTPLQDADALAHVVHDCGARVVVVSGFLEAAVRDARPRLPDLEHVIVYGLDGATAAGNGQRRFEDLVQAEDAECEPVPRHRRDIALLLYSSGLDEPARATAHLQEELLIIPDDYGRHGWGVRPDDVIAGVGPICFAGGYSTILTIPLRYGATTAVIPLGQATPENMFGLVRRYGITVLAAMPTLYQQMLEVPGADDADLQTLRMVTGGGEPLAPATLAAWRQRFGQDIYEGFGTNGMMHVFITNAVTRRVKPGSMGTPVPGYEALVLGPGGREAGVGELGELYVKGPVGTMWWGHPDEAGLIAARQAETVRDGWVRIGDWVRRDEDGYLWFVARHEELVERDGTGFGPVEIERALAGHPAVREAGVWCPGPAPTERAVNALAVLDEAAPDQDQLVAELRARVAEQVGPHAVPDRIDIVDGLPRTLFGTLLRRTQWPGWLAQHA